MKTIKKATARLLMAAILVSVSAASHAQSENPRGIYKLMSLKGKRELKPYPADIYKVITDSVTMRFFWRGNQKMFLFDIPDLKPFNYTGEKAISDENDTEQQIYDSNSKHFTQKWWSMERLDHPIFPHKDWCYEFYESGQYSEAAKPVFDAITAAPASDPKNPLIGTWKLTAKVDKLLKIDNWEDVLEYVRDDDSRQMKREYHIYTPSHTLDIELPKWRPMVNGTILNIDYNSKDKVTLESNRTREIHWLTANAFAIKAKEGDKEKYNIFERVTDKEPMLGRIGSLFINQHKPVQKKNENNIELNTTDF